MYQNFLSLQKESISQEGGMWHLKGIFTVSVGDENGQTSRTGEAKSSVVNVLSHHYYLFCSLNPQLLRPS